jgi:hypothetical protein
MVQHRNNDSTDGEWPLFFPPRHELLAVAAKVCNPPMLLKKFVLQRGKSFDSLVYEGIGGFRYDGHPNGTGTVVL